MEWQLIKSHLIRENVLLRIFRSTRACVTNPDVNIDLRSTTMFDLIQWPAMVVTVIAAWMVGSQKKFKRNWGFWLFLLSNVLWIVWGWQDRAYALIVLQLGLAFLNIRGALKNRDRSSVDKKLKLN